MKYLPGLPLSFSPSTYLECDGIPALGPFGLQPWQKPCANNDRTYVEFPCQYSLTPETPVYDKKKENKPTKNILPISAPAIDCSVRHN